MMNPRARQLSVFYHLGKLFWLRGRDDPKKIRYGDVVLRSRGSTLV